MRCLQPQDIGDVSYDDLAGLYDFPPPQGPSSCWVRANFISSLDGAAQGADHRSGTLSSAADRNLFALQRSLCDLILVGASTTRVEGYRPVRTDEVDADLRSRRGLAPVPAIAVVSHSLALDPALVAGGEAPTVVITSGSAPTEALSSMEATVQVVVAGEDRVDLAAALSRLSELGYRRVLCEGGPTLMADLVAAGCLDDLALTLSPVLLGGDRRRILHGPDLLPPQRLRLAHLLAEGDDLFARYLIEPAVNG